MQESAIVESILTCPVCGFASVDVMPINACIFFHECANCHSPLRPQSGDCCVFCSYGSVTGRRMEFPLCAVYAFDVDDRLAGERIYYDRAAVLSQLGLFHELSRGLGRVVTALSHPLTIARAYLRRSPRNSTESGPPRAA